MRYRCSRICSEVYGRLATNSDLSIPLLKVSPARLPNCQNEIRYAWTRAGPCWTCGESRDKVLADAQRTPLRPVRHPDLLTQDVPWSNRGRERSGRCQRELRDTRRSIEMRCATSAAEDRRQVVRRRTRNHARDRRCLPKGESCDAS